uniref:triacylglycerol lipase n=1 Tax=Romanomermis culicivorax TaxID=13658 RepID=A0A915IQB3_ROMCU
MAGNEADDQECMNISFSGCGFLGIYHVGVASAIKEYAPNLYMNKVAGASAGAIAACGLISNMCLSQATSDVLKIVALARQHQLGPLHPSINLMNILRTGLMKNLPDDAHKMASGRLFISMTRVSDGKNVLVSQFDTKEELIQAMLCSSFIPLYGGTLPPTFRGVRYMDGGFSDNLPILNGNTVTVSPFSGESDICPQDRDSQSFLSFDLTNMNIRFTSRNFYRFSVALFPPHPEIMSSICRQGFEDTLRFLARH